METINSTATPTPCYPREPTVRRAVQASQAQLAAISNSQSLDLELLTKEGDKVTLSINARISALYAALGPVRTDEDDERCAQRGELSAGLYEREVSLTVEGDLNIAERGEIRKVIKAINKMMKNFVAGKLEPVMAKAGRLQGLHTIDNLEVSMAFERWFVVGRQALAAVSYGRSGEALTAPPAPASASGLPF